mmetsp:Transcript_96280/g.171023  ORF Transcript_96280/g.171023 Transcript_96280/m.171023 type:complete len:90 (-) Transcript_96280:450-719(-)
MDAPGCKTGAAQGMEGADGVASGEANCENGDCTDPAPQEHIGVEGVNPGVAMGTPVAGIRADPLPGRDIRVIAALTGGLTHIDGRLVAG